MSVCWSLMTGKPNLGIQKLQEVTEKKNRKAVGGELKTTFQKKVKKGIRIISNIRKLIMDSVKTVSVKDLTCAMKYSVFLLFCNSQCL